MAGAILRWKCAGIVNDICRGCLTFYLCIAHDNETYDPKCCGCKKMGPHEIGLFTVVGGCRKREWWGAAVWAANVTWLRNEGSLMENWADKVWLKMTDRTCRPTSNVVQD